LVYSDTFSIDSSGLDAAEITATVLDENNGALEGVTVVFSTDSGQLSQSTATTDSSGNATVQLSAGNLDRSNRNITVTAQVSGVESDSTVVQVTGTTVQATLLETGLEPGSNQTVTLQVQVNDANGPVADTDVVVTSSGSGSVSPSSAQGTTDISGVYELELTDGGTGSTGTVTLTVEAAGVSVDTEAITISGDAFRITAPTAANRSMTTDESVTVTVSVPDGITQVRFSTTLGVFDDDSANVDKPVSGGTASAVLTADNAGVATVQVADYEDLDPSETIQIGVAAPALAAANLSLQGSASVVALSQGTVTNSVSLTATVTNETEEPVGGSIVQFSLQNAPGGGEFLSPTMVLTDSQGNASTTFTSGAISSDDDVTIVAQVLNYDTDTYAEEPSDTFGVAIGGTAGSIMIGRGTTINSVDSDTAYSQPFVVVVADANGNPVEGALVSLSSWPVRYYDGVWVEVGDEWVIDYYASAYNEDVNENVRLDEDIDYDSDGDDIVDIFNYDEDEYDIDNACILAGESIPTLILGGNGDGLLTPANSAAGTLDPVVTTDEFGKGQFDLVYAKASATWIKVRISATTTVLGTETKALLTLILPHAESDEGNLPNSPYDDLNGLIGDVTDDCP
jgi:protocatechuate 3,4-dioxygenase beta subunit